MINRLDAIVFDKTGTLTIGKPIVNGVRMYLSSEHITRDSKTATFDSEKKEDHTKTLILSDAERFLCELV
ncbi:hypothetical protein K7432_017886, partial [Basidiobolus ranarum]